MIYIVKDNTGTSIRMFHTKEEAIEFRAIYNRLDWKVKEKMRAEVKSTERQRLAVHFCEKILNIEFHGDISNKIDCHKYLKMWLDLAKQEYDALRCEYEAYREEYDND